MDFRDPEDRFDAERGDGARLVVDIARYVERVYVYFIGIQWVQNKIYFASPGA